MKHRIFYTGDINPENGGFFYTLEGVKFDYVSVLRITPCSDAGGPDNLFWLERLTVNLRNGAELYRLLTDCGYTVESFATASKAIRRHIAIQAHIYAGAYDQEQSVAVQIGKRDPFFDYRGEWEETRVDVQLRAGTDIGRYARRMFHEMT